MTITSTFSFLEPERDPRIMEGLTNIGAMRRKDLWRLADKMGVPYQDGATKEEMERILSAVPNMVEAVNSAVGAAQESENPLVDQITNQLQRLEKEEGQGEIEGEILKAAPMHKVRSEAKSRGIEYDKKTSKDELLDKMNVK